MEEDEVNKEAAEGEDCNMKNEKESKEKHHSLYTCKIINCVTCAENFILNLSNHTLSVPEKLVLSKGLTFIPIAWDLTNFEILTDFNMFADKLCKRINPPCINPCTDGFNLHRHNKNRNNKPNLLTKYPKFEGALEAMKDSLAFVAKWDATCQECKRKLATTIAEHLSDLTSITNKTNLAIRADTKENFKALKEMDSSGAANTIKGALANAEQLRQERLENQRKRKAENAKTAAASAKRPRKRTTKYTIFDSICNNYCDCNTLTN